MISLTQYQFRQHTAVRRAVISNSPSLQMRYSYLPGRAALTGDGSYQKTVCALKVEIDHPPIHVCAGYTLSLYVQIKYPMNSWLFLKKYYAFESKRVEMPCRVTSCPASGLGCGRKIWGYASFCNCITGENRQPFSYIFFRYLKQMNIIIKNQIIFDNYKCLLSIFPMIHSQEPEIQRLAYLHDQWTTANSAH